MTKHLSTRPRRWSLIAAPIAGVLVLAGCAGGDGGGGDAGTDTGFSLMISQANDAEDYYPETIKKFTEATGIDVELIPYPADAYITQLTTQLQAGNAADMMIVAPGTGQPISVITLAEAGFLLPIGGSVESTIPAGAEAQYQVEGKTYAQPTALTPVGFVYNEGAASSAGVDEYPATYDDLLDACSAARDGGLSFTVLAGAIPANSGLMAQLISATRVYEETPDWNEQRTAGDVTFADSDGWKETLEDIVEMNEAGCFQDGAAGGSFDSITAALGGGTALTAAVPGNSATSIGEAAGIDLTVRSFPPAEGQSDFLLASANYAWGVNAKVDDSKKESIQTFLDWLATPEEAVAFADLAGGVPIVGATPDNLLAPYAPVGDLLESGSFTGLPNSAWPNPAVYDALGAGVQGLLTGQKTVDQVLEDMDSAWG